MAKRNTINVEQFTLNAGSKDKTFSMTRYKPKQEMGFRCT